MRSRKPPKPGGSVAGLWLPLRCSLVPPTAGAVKSAVHDHIQRVEELAKLPLLLSLLSLVHYTHLNAFITNTLIYTQPHTT